MPAGVRGLPVATVFLGGGTPSVIASQSICSLLDRMQSVFTFLPDVEISVEANPEDITPVWVEAMQKAHVNRFSCGIQSFVCTQALNRRHTPEQAVRAVQIMRQQGVNNLNIDMMFALPNQTLADLDQDLRILLELAPEHISWYALTLAPNTTLQQEVQIGKWQIPNENTWIILYERIQDQLKASGYEQYEISNWARPGCRCRHNERIWQGADYLGFGPGAASRIGKWRWKDPFPPSIFLQATQNLQTWNFPLPPPWAVEAEMVDEIGEDLETLLTGIRLLEGFNIARLHGKLESQCICSLQTQGLLWQTNDRIGPTRRGLSLADTVLIQLVRGLQTGRPTSCI